MKMVRSGICDATATRCGGDGPYRTVSPRTEPKGRTMTKKATADAAASAMRAAWIAEAAADEAWRAAAAAEDAAKAAADAVLRAEDAADDATVTALREAVGAMRAAAADAAAAAAAAECADAWIAEAAEAATTDRKRNQ
jgi:hypothetical protein